MWLEYEITDASIINKHQSFRVCKITNVYLNTYTENWFTLSSPGFEESTSNTHSKLGTILKAPPSWWYINFMPGHVCYGIVTEDLHFTGIYTKTTWEISRAINSLCTYPVTLSFYNDKPEVTTDNNESTTTYASYASHHKIVF